MKRFQKLMLLVGSVSQRWLSNAHLHVNFIIIVEILGREFLEFDPCVPESEIIEAHGENEEILGLDGGQGEVGSRN